MVNREPYEVLVELHSGGTLHLTLSDQDEKLAIRACVLSLPLQDQIVQDFHMLLGDDEQNSKPITIFRLKLDGAKAEPCVVCRSRLSFSGKGEFSLCGEHYNWRKYIKLSRGI